MSVEAGDPIQQARQVLSGYEPQLIVDPTLRPAAVLLLLFEAADEAHVLLIERTQNVTQHKGQVAFPGGSREESDADVVETALREAEEEVGLARAEVEVIGRLDDMITRTGYLVSPVVGVLRPGASREFIPQEWEVARVLEVPLGHLADPANFGMMPRELRGRMVELQTFHWGGLQIWGATAEILRGFLDLLGYPQ
ncbi:MAG TPA: CoA pyrophosphatase [Dehalococcoidia bacterium]|nr:CoA pyrophosphatase [Dehalococcoidia bacterium]